MFERIGRAIALLQRNAVMLVLRMYRPATLVDPHAHKRNQPGIKSEGHGMSRGGRVQRAPSLREPGSEVLFRNVRAGRLHHAQVYSAAIFVSGYGPGAAVAPASQPACM